MKTLISICLIPLFLLVSPLSAEAKEPTFQLKEKIQKAKAGDFIVTEQDHTYSLLFIRESTADRLLLEEIAAPNTQIDLKTIRWDQWVKEKAPGHTAWTLYEIDAPSGALIEAFSYSKKGWLYLDETQQFLTKLLSLSLEKLHQDDRRKIGPPQLQAETDRRAVWNPPLIINGKKYPKPQFDVWKGRWPDDGTQISLCELELYFSTLQSAFPFPYWIEVKSSHYTFKMRSVDSGSGIVSPYSGPIPHRPPQFTGPIKKMAETYRLTLHCPLYYNGLHLYAIDLSEPSLKPISIPHQLTREGKTETVHLDLSSEKLGQLMTPHHRYQWVLIPEGDGKVYVESDETFTPK